MRPLRRQPPPGRRRQRLAEPTLPLARPEISFNTGRQVKRTDWHQALNFWLQRTGLLILLLAVVAAVTSALTLSTYPKVVPLDQSTSPFLRPMGTYEAAAAKLLSSSIWNRNKLTIDTSHISQDLAAQFPELSSASLTLPLLAHRPIIYLQPAKPVLVLSGQGGSFVVADSGQALLRADNPASLAKYNLLPATDQSGLKLSVGHQALPAGDVAFIQTVTAELSAKGYKVSGLVLPTAAAELDVQLAGQPYLVKFNLHSQKARQAAGTFLATINYLKKQNTTPAHYVDVRVDGRAYYQ